MLTPLMHELICCGAFVNSQVGTCLNMIIILYDYLISWCYIYVIIVQKLICCGALMDSQVGT